MLFTKEDYKLVFDGFIIKDCAIRSINRQIYLLVEDDDEKIKDGYLPQYRFAFTYNEREDVNQRLSCKARNSLNNPKIAYNANGNELIGLDISGNLYSHSAGDREEDKLSQKLKGSEYNSIYQNVKTIGDSMYAIGDPHKLYKRKGLDDWEDLSESIPLPSYYLDGTLAQSKVKPGWRDADGFSEQDIYLVGGDGDVWHYDGNVFKQCDFPSNEPLANVCCAGDGYVYIGARAGRLWKGKDNQWELISKAELTTRWLDIVWFDDRLFLGGDYGLWEFKDDKVIKAEVPAEVITCSGSLSLCPENKLLLTAGNHGASMYDGKEWKVLFDRFDLED